MLKKDNFFNPNENIWDIGWPCSPRKMLIAIVSSTVILLSLITFIL